MSAIGQVEAGVAGTYSTNKTGKTTKSEYGNTIGDVKLSDKAAKYYEELKSKYSDMGFVLVSNDEVDGAEQKAQKYANSNRTLVLIDAEKIEKMAEDEEYRKKYEGIIAGANTQLDQLKESIGKGTLANVKTFGIRVDDNGNTSFFAVVDKSLAAQKERIEKNRKEKAEDKKEADAKEAKERLERSRDKTDAGRTNTEKLETISATSIEGLVKKLNDSYYASLSDTVRTAQEQMVGTTMDFKL